MIRNLAWKKIVPEDRVKTIIVPLFNNYSNYWGMKVLSIPESVCKIVDRMMEATECRMSEEQGGFMKGRGVCESNFHSDKKISSKR